MKQEFSSWLKLHKGFTEAVVKDVVSRLKRAETFCDMNWQADSASNVFSLSQSDGFGDLSVSVKSQLRRAVKLYVEFLGDHKPPRRRE